MYHKKNWAKGNKWNFLYPIFGGNTGTKEAIYHLFAVCNGDYFIEQDDKIVSVDHALQMKEIDSFGERQIIK